MSPKINLIVRPRKPEFDIRGSAYVISPDFKGRVTLEPKIQRDWIEVKVPRLRVYDLLIIE